MKVIAVFQFYFPYVLPREDDWQGRGVAFQFPQFIVKVRPRNLEEELFPHEIDKTLSTMKLSLTRLSLPVSSVSRTVQDMCLDRIEVFTEGEINSGEEIKKPEVQAAYEEAAIHGCNLFVEHCRVMSRAHFVVGVEEHYRLQDGKTYVITPHSITWFDGDSGEKLPTYVGNNNATATSGSVPSPERGSGSMSLIQQSLSKNSLPDLTQSLLLDAKERIITMRTREAIISVATACEVAANEYLQRKGKVNDVQVKKLLGRRVSFAEKRFHLITGLVSGKSLKNEDFPTFDSVEKVYRTRNNVAHEGRAYYEDGGSAIEVNAARATEFMDSAGKAVRWLTAL